MSVSMNMTQRKQDIAEIKLHWARRHHDWYGFMYPTSLSVTCYMFIAIVSGCCGLLIYYFMLHNDNIISWTAETTHSPKLKEDRGRWAFTSDWRSETVHAIYTEVEDSGVVKEDVHDS